MIFLRILLAPFSLIYWLLTTFRNHLYEIGYSRSFQFDTCIINVGNLRVGGTGKTPHVEYIIRLLRKQYKLATLSRGYGRKTKGFILADAHATARTIGDEPLQFYTKFSPDVAVAVGEERALAIPTILFEKPETQVIVLDDAYQHRTVKPHLNILLTDYRHPFYKDVLLPSGRLRESRKGARRADIVIVTKCPWDLSQSFMADIAANVRKYTAQGTPVFFSGIRYAEPQPLRPEHKDSVLKKVLLVSGVADAQPLLEEVKRKYELEQVLEFGDHYTYDEKSIYLILKQFYKIEGSDKGIITTEKDMMKWREEPLKSLLAEIPVFYLPIEISFLEKGEMFDQMVMDCVLKKS